VKTDFKNPPAHGGCNADSNSEAHVTLHPGTNMGSVNTIVFGLARKVSKLQQ